MKTDAASLVALMLEFDTEQKCIDHLVEVRWPKGVDCVRCNDLQIYARKDGQFRCGDCGYTFSARKGTIFEGSNVPLRKWFAAIWLVTNSPKGISSYQLGRTLGVTQKTAWRMLTRLRAVAESDVGEEEEEQVDGVIEIDEVYIGGVEKWKHGDKKDPTARGGSGKMPVVGLYQRDGTVRFEFVPFVNYKALHTFVEHHVKEGATVYTDDNPGYSGLGKKYDHHVVNHSKKKYVEDGAHVNSAESMWALLRRGYRGTFHFWTREYMSFYLAEFAFRQNIKDLESPEKMDKMLDSSQGVRVKVSDMKRVSP